MQRKSRQKRSLYKRGVSGLEILVAVVLVTLVALPAITLMQQSGRGVEKTGDAMLVGAIAKFIAGDLRDKSFDEVKPLKWTSLKKSKGKNSALSFLKALKAQNKTDDKGLKKLENQFESLRYRLEVKEDTPNKSLKTVTIHLEMKGRPSRLRRSFTTILARRK